MAYPNSNAFLGGSASGAPGKGSQQRLALDNLLRRELKVGDPSDPAQIAQALLNKYQHDPRANAIAMEAKGLPFLHSAAPTALTQSPTSTDLELQQAKNDVERDLQELLSDALVKDIQPEIQGWAQAIRSTIQEGANAARFALDATQRDKAFAMRRQLGDYARMARLVGAMTPAMNSYYRKLALSLDEVAAVFLVLMGESLSNVGYNGGRFLLQAPYGELQVRRDAVIYALRNLVGSTQQTYDQNTWPRGLDAYRTLFRFLEDQGQGDLRSLLSEQELARAMDELIERSAHGTAEGLRALGATALIDLERFRRLVYLGQYSVSPESPPLTTFLEALQLFNDAFKQSGGFRLVRCSRPPILFYGLYGNSEMDESDNRMLQLIIYRGRLADRLDSLAGYDIGLTPVGDTSVRKLVVLDKILYDVDRAIDLYAMGQHECGQPERRAAAYYYVIEALPPALDIAPGVPLDLYIILNNIKTNIMPNMDQRNAEMHRVMLDLYHTASRIVGFIGFANTYTDALFLAPGAMDVHNIPKVDEDHLFYDWVLLYKLTKQAIFDLRKQPNPHYIEMPKSAEHFFGLLGQELCVQKDIESHWENLVRSMSPSSVGIKYVLDGIHTVLDAALTSVAGDECRRFRPTIPPNFETSLDSIVDDVDRMGRGR